MRELTRVVRPLSVELSVARARGSSLRTAYGVVCRAIVGLLVTVMSAAAADDPATASAGPASSKELRAEVVSALIEGQVIGAAFAVIDGHEAFIETYGTADAAGNRVITDHTPFAVGSISKNVTSLLALTLARKGILDLDADVRPLLPEAAAANGWNDFRPITLAHLLEHTAGLPGSSYAEYGLSRAGVAPADYEAHMRGRLRLRWQPGSYYSYANAGHTIAALVMERVAQEPFDVLVAEHVFAPLEMRRSSFHPSRREADDPLSDSFDRVGSRQPVWLMPMRPSGAMVASIADMAALLGVYIGGPHAGGSAAIAGPQDLDRMRRGRTSLHARARYDMAYGLGSFAFFAAGHAFHGHWGKTDGFLAVLGYLPGQQRGFVVLSNTSNREAMTRVREIIAGYLTRDLPPRGEPPRVAMSAADLERYTGWYQPITHDMAMRAWIFRLLGTTHISAARDRLEAHFIFNPFKGWSLLPVGDGQFRRQDETFTSTVFIADDDGHMTFIDSAQETFVYITHAEGWLTAVGAALVATSLPLAILLLVVALHSRIVRRGMTARAVHLTLGPRPRLGQKSSVGHESKTSECRNHEEREQPAMLLGLSALVLVAFGAGFYRLGLGGDISSVARLGSATVEALVLMASSILWPLLAISGASLVVIRWRQLGGIMRALLSLAAGGLLVVAGVALAEGWLPLVTWAW